MFFLLFFIFEIYFILRRNLFYLKSHVHGDTDGAIYEPKINYKNASHTSLFWKVRKNYYESTMFETGRGQGTTLKRMT